MERAPETTGSTAPQERNVASQLEGHPTPISPIGLATLPETPNSIRWIDTRHSTAAAGSPAVSHRPQRKDGVLTREANLQTSNQHGGDTFESRPLSPSEMYTKRTIPSERSSGLKSLVPSGPEKSQKAKQHRPGGSTVGHLGATQATKSSPAKLDVFMVERSIEFLHERADQVALGRRQEKSDGRQKTLESKAQVIDMKLKEQQRTLTGLYEKSRWAQVPKEVEEDQPASTPTAPLLGGEAFQKPLPVRKQPSIKSLRAFAAADKTTVPLGPVLKAEPSRPEAGSTEDEWMNIKLEDAEIPLGQEEWEDDIVSDSIPKGPKGSIRNS